MPRQYIVLFVLVLSLVAFGAYKVGDYYGFEAGQKYGYGLDCREDLERLKDVINHIKVAVDYANRSAVNFSESRKQAVSLVQARRYNENRDSLLKHNPDNSVLRAIKSYDEDGTPNFDEDYLKCLTGLDSCD